MGRPFLEVRSFDGDQAPGRAAHGGAAARDGERASAPDKGAAGEIVVTRRHFPKEAHGPRHLPRSVLRLAEACRDPRAGIRAAAGTGRGRFRCRTLTVAAGDRATLGMNGEVAEASRDSRPADGAPAGRSAG